MKISSMLLHVIIICAMTLFMMMINYQEHGVQFICYYYSFFVLGYYINNYWKDKMPKGKWFWLCFTLWFMGAQFWRMHEIPVFLSDIRLLPPTVLVYLYRFIIAILASIAFYGILKKYCHRLRVSSVISKLGLWSLGIYVVHITIINMIKPLFVYIVNEEKILFIPFLFIVILMGAVLIVYLLSKNKYSKRYLLGKV